MDYCCGTTTRNVLLTIHGVYCTRTPCRHPWQESLATPVCVRVCDVSWRSVSSVLRRTRSGTCSVSECSRPSTFDRPPPPPLSTRSPESAYSYPALGMMLVFTSSRLVKQESCAIAKMIARCALKVLRLPDYAYGYFPKWFWCAFVLIDSVNVRIKFEMRSLSRSWDNSDWSS